MINYSIENEMIGSEQDFLDLEEHINIVDDTVLIYSIIPIVETDI